MSPSEKLASRNLLIENDVAAQHDGPIEEGHNSDASAQALGYKSAVVSGNISLNHVCRAVTEAWGRDWLERGGMSIRWRRPLYHGDEVRLEFSPLRSQDNSAVSDYTITNDAGEACVIGEVYLSADAIQPPDLEQWPVSHLFRPTYEVAATMVGAPLPTVSGKYFPVEIADKARSGDFDSIQERSFPLRLFYLWAAHDLDVLREAQPTLLADKVITPWQLDCPVYGNMERSDANRFGMQTGARFRFYGTAIMGDDLEWRSRVAKAWEHKGSKYIELDFIVIANQEKVVQAKSWTTMYDFAVARAAGVR